MALMLPELRDAVWRANQGFVVSHIGLNNNARWDEFRELDLDDQSLIHDWLTAEARDDESERGTGEPRRFDIGVLVDHELVSHFVDKPFLDPEDDRILDELLARPLGAGLTLGDVVDRETLRERLRERIAATAEQPALIPITPQRRRQGARKRLSERTGSVAARVLTDLGLSRAGREIAKLVGGPPAANVQVMTRLLNREINSGLGIPSAARKTLSAEQAEVAVARLDAFGNAVRDRLRQELGAWMHTFSPAKMWIAGLQALRTPLLHLHTQFNRDLPWGEIDMDFMNLNQAAHGDREFAHIEARLGLARKAVSGHWQDSAVAERVGAWARAACGRHDAQHLKVARLGDNMRQVAVTEGDKTEVQIKLGASVNGFAVGDLAEAVRAVPDVAVEALVDEYEASYAVAPSLRAGGADREALREAARIEAALRAFMSDGGFGALTDTFENLDGLRQLPGIAVQRLMADGFGFGAEGDWKTAIMVRLEKTMARGLPGGTSFMEDYTYHLDPAGPLVLGSHMLETCPTIAEGRPSCEIHPLSIGGRSDPVRLVFDAAPGPATATALMDMGDRLRLLVNEVEVVRPPEPTPRLPVGRAVWRPRPDFATATEAWLMAGGSHHTVLSRALGTEVIADFAEMTGIELLVIDAGTTIREFGRELRWNEAYHRLTRGR